MPLLILFIAIPMIEIALFIQVGGLIGLWPTLLIVLLTAIVGSWMVRQQGARELAMLRRNLSELRDPTEPLANGAMILLSGALLLTPGFFTDAVGLLLLLPPVRAYVFTALKQRVKMSSFQMGPQPSQRPHHGPQDRVIDGEFEEIDPNQRQTHKPSQWTRH